ncbi:gluzincin family metallopeptidase [Nocardioides terrisoli]|uniref:hypothetical protein n=1 Tax=Nocardioides terrisoli TaxID=3388267 RepID=UPI00287BB169|nr:hypothetical protein [Nocardioides marmorisolisilvae]
MRSDLAEPRRWRATGLVAALLLVALAALAGCSHEVSIRPPKPPQDVAASRADAAQQALDTLRRAIATGRPAPDLAAPGAAALVPQILRNAAALRVRHVSLDYLDANLGVPSRAQAARFGAGAWVASVQISYRIPEDTGATHMEAAFTFVPGRRTATIAAIGGHGERSPLWMRGSLQVRRTARTLVLDAGPGSPAPYVRLAKHAVRDVNLVLPRWRGRLVIEVPASEGELDSVLDAQRATYANIAAVTTTVDGSTIRGAPVHVFLNPSVFGTLKTKGAQVVVSHETTHVATNAPFAQMPTWLLEGFADYVALDHAGVPVQTAAAQILARIRKHGLPHGLPTATDLEPTAGGLGATYEEAWLACHYLGATYGEAKLVAFYRAVDHGMSLSAAFRNIVGVSQAQFVAGWRQDLARLAG